MKTSFAKARNEPVTAKFLAARIDHSISRGYSKQKWIEFCEAVMERGLTMTLYEARNTWSKYITIRDGHRAFKVRFSNHKPNRGRELDGDCDFFVGITHTGVRTTTDAISALDVWIAQSTSSTAE